jgi:hypothetical protein
MALGFASDIRPLFRDSPDVDSMQGYGLDLSSYADVKARAAEIYEALANGSMPCDEAWPKERLELFKQWMDEGFVPSNGTRPPGSLLHFCVVGIHPAGFLHRLDQIFNFHLVRVVFHHRFFLSQRNVDLLNTLHCFQCRLHRGYTGASGHAANCERDGRFLRSH